MPWPDDFQLTAEDQLPQRKLADHFQHAKAWLVRDGERFREEAFIEQRLNTVEQIQAII